MAADRPLGPLIEGRDAPPSGRAAIASPCCRSPSKDEARAPGVRSKGQVVITLHHLEFSRSTRILWLLEELGVPFELVAYKRTVTFQAPAELKAIHPLGKSPVIVDDGLTVAESATILRYLEVRYGDGRLIPFRGSAAFWLHEEWLDYVESSAAFPIMLTVVGGMRGGLPDGLASFAKGGVALALKHIEAGVAQGPFLMGEQLTLADMQMSYLLELALFGGLLTDYPAIKSYLDRLHQQPALRRAIERGGPMPPPAKP